MWLLLVPSAACIQKILEGLFVAVAYGNVVFPKHYPSSFHQADFVFLYDEGTVYPYEFRGGE